MMNMKQKVVSVCCLLLLLSGCDWFTRHSNDDKPKHKESTKQSVVANKDKQKNHSHNDDTSLSALYDVQPDVKNCNTGQLKKSEKLKVLKRVNDIRKIHGLSPVIYNYKDDIDTAKSALISVANAKLSHQPPKYSHCWSQEGYNGSNNSNLHLNLMPKLSKLSASDSHVISFLIDDRVESLGHRRWVLDPFLSSISYGRVDGQPIVHSQWKYTTGASLKVINDKNAKLDSKAVDFVAYPFHQYPKAWFKKDWYLSFSVLADNSSRWQNSNVDYTNATITVTNPDGHFLRVYGTNYNNENYGLPNHLQWKVSGIQDNTRYQVNITNVKVNGQSKGYQYWFETK